MQIPVYAVDKVAKSQVQVVRNEMWKVFNTIYLKHFNHTAQSTLGYKNLRWGLKIQPCRLQISHYVPIFYSESFLACANLNYDKPL